MHRVQPKHREAWQEAKEAVAKFFFPEPDKDADTAFRTIAQEVVVLAAVQEHPNIIGFQGFFHTDGESSLPWPSSAEYALMMDYCCCGNLSEQLQEGFFSEGAAADVMNDLLSALAHVHFRGFVHRDVKLENIMCVPDGRVILTDLGLACHESDTEEMKRRCGTPGYCAPEMVAKKAYDAKVDVFAAGVVLYALVFRQLPFVGSDLVSIFRSTVKCRPNFEVPPERDGLSSNCMHFLRLLLRRRAVERPRAEEALDRSWLRQQHQSATPEQASLLAAASITAALESHDAGLDVTPRTHSHLQRLEDRLSLQFTPRATADDDLGSELAGVPQIRPPSASANTAFKRRILPLNMDYVAALAAASTDASASKEGSADDPEEQHIDVSVKQPSKNRITPLKKRLHRPMKEEFGSGSTRAPSNAEPVLGEIPEGDSELQNSSAHKEEHCRSTHDNLDDSVFERASSDSVIIRPTPPLELRSIRARTPLELRRLSPFEDCIVGA